MILAFVDYTQCRRVTHRRICQYSAWNACNATRCKKRIFGSALDGQSVYWPYVLVLTTCHKIKPYDMAIRTTAEMMQSNISF